MLADYKCTCDRTGFKGEFYFYLFFIYLIFIALSYFHFYLFIQAIFVKLTSTSAQKISHVRVVPVTTSKEAMNVIVLKIFVAQIVHAGIYAL